MISHRTLLRFALSGGHAFAWIFVFQFYTAESGDVATGFVVTLLAYALSHTIAILATPLGARLLRRGTTRMMRNATLALSAAFLVLAASLIGLFGSVQIGVLVFAIGTGLYRALYWVPYSLSPHPTALGEEITIALAPALAGLTLAASSSGVAIVLGGAALVTAAAYLALGSGTGVHETYVWRYRESFHQLFSAQHHRPLLRSVADGFEAGALLFVWPLVAFVLLGWSYALLGLVFALTLLATIALKYLLPRGHRADTPLIHATVTVSAWLIRGLVATPIGIVAVDAYADTGGRALHRGIDISTKEQSAEQHTFLDELTALKEMGQGIGRLLLCLAAAVSLLSFNMYTAALVIFALAALATVYSTYLSTGK